MSKADIESVKNKFLNGNDCSNITKDFKYGRTLATCFYINFYQNLSTKDFDITSINNLWDRGDLNPDLRDPNPEACH